tara:strand:+ start:4000 stop:5466 length:1467 start_codon:yes stop_codon:yes gene_type:complete
MASSNFIPALKRNKKIVDADDSDSKFKGGFERYASKGMNNLGGTTQTYIRPRRGGKPGRRSGTNIPGSGGRPIGRAGNPNAGKKVYTSGKNAGKTQQQVFEKARKHYAGMSDHKRKAYEDQANGMDIRSEREKKILKGNRNPIGRAQTQELRSKNHPNQRPADRKAIQEKQESDFDLLTGTNDAIRKATEAPSALSNVNTDGSPKTPAPKTPVSPKKLVEHDELEGTGFYAEDNNAENVFNPYTHNSAPQSPQSPQSPRPKSPPKEYKNHAGSWYDKVKGVMKDYKPDVTSKDVPDTDFPTDSPSTDSPSTEPKGSKPLEGGQNYDGTGVLIGYRDGKKLYDNSKETQAAASRARVDTAANYAAEAHANTAAGREYSSEDAVSRKHRKRVEAAANSVRDKKDQKTRVAAAWDKRFKDMDQATKDENSLKSRDPKAYNTLMEERRVETDAAYTEKNTKDIQDADARMKANKSHTNVSGTPRAVSKASRY